MTLRRPTFKAMLRRMPRCLCGLDQEKTPADFAALAEHELDLYYEGEETDIHNARDLAAVKRFMAWCRRFGESPDDRQA